MIRFLWLVVAFIVFPSPAKGVCDLEMYTIESQAESLFNVEERNHALAAIRLAGTMPTAMEGERVRQMRKAFSSKVPQIVAIADELYTFSECNNLLLSEVAYAAYTLGFREIYEKANFANQKGMLMFVLEKALVCSRDPDLYDIV